MHSKLPLFLLFQLLILSIGCKDYTDYELPISCNSNWSEMVRDSNVAGIAILQAIEHCQPDPCNWGPQVDGGQFTHEVELYHFRWEEITYGCAPPVSIVVNQTDTVVDGLEIGARYIVMGVGDVLRPVCLGQQPLVKALSSIADCKRMRIARVNDDDTYSIGGWYDGGWTKYSLDQFRQWSTEAHLYDVNVLHRSSPSYGPGFTFCDGGLPHDSGEDAGC